LIVYTFGRPISVERRKRNDGC